MNITPFGKDFSPDNRERLSIDTIGSFFAKRPWLRPKDWLDIKDLVASPTRIRELSIYIYGYISGRPSREFWGS